MGMPKPKDMKKGVGYCVQCGHGARNRKSMEAHVKKEHGKGKVK